MVRKRIRTLIENGSILTTIGTRVNFYQLFLINCRCRWLQVGVGPFSACLTPVALHDLLRLAVSSDEDLLRIAAFVRG